jgi:hypothetical protein
MGAPSFLVTAGLFFNFYLWCTILWNIGSGYNQFDKLGEMVHLFRWGFPGGNCHICIQFFMRDIQAIRMEVQEGIHTTTLHKQWVVFNYMTIKTSLCYGIIRM